MCEKVGIRVVQSTMLHVSMPEQSLGWFPFSVLAGAYEPAPLVAHILLVLVMKDEPHGILYSLFKVLCVCTLASTNTHTLVVQSLCTWYVYTVNL